MYFDLSKNTKFNQLILLIIASFTLGIAVNSYMIARLGSDSITIFEDGIHTTFHISMGMAALTYNIIFLTLCFIFARKYIGIVTVIFCFISAPAIDFVGIILQPIFGIQGIWLRCLFVVLGILFTSLTSAILIIANGGMNMLDALATKLSEVTKYSYKVWRTLGDITLMVIGFILGGTLGFGTIFAVGLTGITIAYLVKLLQKYIGFTKTV